MSAAAQPAQPVEVEGLPLHTTLLELVEAVSEVTENEHEIVATVIHMLRAGRVRLCGAFRNQPFQIFLD